MKISKYSIKGSVFMRFAFVFFTSVLTAAGLLSVLANMPVPQTLSAATSSMADPVPTPPDEYVAPVIVGRRPASFTTPEAGIEANQKLIQAIRESYLLEGIIGQVRLGGAMQLNYKGQRYTIYQDLDDPDRTIKFDGVNQGVRILVDKGISLPTNLSFYIVRDQDRIVTTAPFCLDAQGKMIIYDLPDGTTWPKCWRIPMAQAIERDRNWAPVAKVIISSLRNVAETSLSSQGINGLSKIPITTIHETCHILHERRAGEFFWTIPAEPPVNRDVSLYANKAKKEFVAEVCAGLVLGLNWFPRVLTEYQQYRGPVIPR